MTTSHTESRGCPYVCAACREAGHWHCSDPERCGSMRHVEAGEAQSDDEVTHG
jgi:hypothetical protein